MHHRAPGRPKTTASGDEDPGDGESPRAAAAERLLVYAARAAVKFVWRPYIFVL
jgi:hypothetical protein